MTIFRVIWRAFWRDRSHWLLTMWALPNAAPLLALMLLIIMAIMPRPSPAPLPHDVGHAPLVTASAPSDPVRSPSPVQTALSAVPRNPVILSGPDAAELVPMLRHHFADLYQYQIIDDHGKAALVFAAGHADYWIRWETAQQPASLVLQYPVARKVRNEILRQRFAELGLPAQALLQRRLHPESPAATMTLDVKPIGQIHQSSSNITGVLSVVWLLLVVLTGMLCQPLAMKWLRDDVAVGEVWLWAAAGPRAAYRVMLSRALAFVAIALCYAAAYLISLLIWGGLAYWLLSTAVDLGRAAMVGPAAAAAIQAFLAVVADLVARLPTILPLLFLTLAGVFTWYYALCVAANVWARDPARERFLLVPIDVVQVLGLGLVIVSAGALAVPIPFLGAPTVLWQIAGGQLAGPVLFGVAQWLSGIVVLLLLTPRLTAAARIRRVQM